MAVATGTALLAAGAMAAGGAVYSGSQASKASEKAASSQAGATMQATAMQLEYLREVRSDIAEAVDEGLIDLETGYTLAMQEEGFDPVRNYVSLMKEPGSVMDRPGARFQYEQGLDALQAGFSRSSGGGLSGDIVRTAQEYGQNYAATMLDKELARLGPLMNLQTQGASAKANLRVGGATGTANIGAQMMPGIAQGVQQLGQIGATDAINQANINTGMVSGITNTASDMAALYALRPELFSKG